METDDKDKIVPFNGIQGVTSTNVPAYSNQHDFISFEGCYVHGIFTGYKWQCVEYARRWLLLRKSCIFQNVASASDMWKELTYVERVTDGQKFPIKTCSNGSPTKPKCDSFLIYPRVDDILPYGHIAVICEVHDDFIRIAEQNFQYDSWSSNYSRQIPLIKRNNLYYLEDRFEICGWMEIESIEELKPLNRSILEKYQQIQPTGKLECCSILNKSCYHLYYKADEDFILNLSRTSNELYRLFIQVTESVIHNDDLLIGFSVPKTFWSKIRQSWKNERKYDIIDYLNFTFDGNKFKLCQYITDDPLKILQSAIVQDKNVQTMNFDYNFTSCFQLHRLLVRRWKQFNINTKVHILIDNEQEELATALYMKEVMIEAGIQSKICRLPDDLYRKNSDIYDKDNEIIEIVWKLWNWEMIFQEYSDYREEKLIKDEHPCLIDILFHDKIKILEPIWKSITTHTMLLPVLHTMFPDHPNILQDEWILFDDSKDISSINENILLYNTNEYFNDCSIPQELSTGTSYDKTIISWIVNGLFSGFSIRDEQNRIMDTNNCQTYSCVI